MTKNIHSDALTIMNRSLGLYGAGAPLTELQDGVVDQVIDITNVARRSLTQQVRGGIYTATFRNVHTDAETISNTVQAYSVLGSLTRPPFPNPFIERFDQWLLQAAVRQVSGGGTLLATLGVRYPGNQAWGHTDAGGQVLVAQVHRLAHWNAIISDGTNFGILAGSEQPTANIGLRLARGTEITFISTSSITVSYDCQLTLGVFPAAFGQDVLIG